MAWCVVGSGIAEEEREKAEGGPITGPAFLAASPVFTLSYPCNRQPFDCIFNLPARIYVYVCLPVYIPMKS
jgi:hypothetical protein